MPTTLLAVDDSVTMRKVLEITFAGEDFRVVTADSADAAIAKLHADKPAIVLTDVTLGATTGYQLAAKIKQESPTTPVIILASKQQPYDAAKGSSARADDFIEKPFDTQQLIDKVRKALAGGAKVEAPAAAAAPAPRPAPTPGPAPVAARPGVGTGTLPIGQRAPVAPTPIATPIRHSPPAAAVSAPDPSHSVRGTLAYAPAVAARAKAGGEDGTFSPTPATGVPLTSTPVAAPARPAAPAAAPAAPVAAALGANGALAGQLAGLGLTEAQVAGVLALSRDVVEKVVWEVVPVLAETIIKEELKRLTSE